MDDYLTFGDNSSPLTLVLAHGAGLPMNAPFMVNMAQSVALEGFQVVLFDFDYMKRRKLEGRQFPPDRQDKLLARWHQVLADWSGCKLVIGGKSMGGRIASIIMAQTPDAAEGLVCLGYPFHPPGRPENLRVAHLMDLTKPTLICQGERDPFGTRKEFDRSPFPDCVEFYWLADGEHSFRPRVSSGLTEEQNLSAAAAAVSGFLKSLAESA